MPKANPEPHVKTVRLTLDRSEMAPRERCVFISSSVAAGFTQTLEHAVLVRLANVSLPQRKKVAYCGHLAPDCWL